MRPRYLWRQDGKRHRLPRLRQGQNVDASVGEYILALRPVQAKQGDCLGCHAGARLNDTLGVMVYAIARGSQRTSKQR